MKITICVSDDRIRDAIGSAHISYWADPETRWNKRKMTLRVREDVGERDTDAWFTLNTEDFARALVRMADSKNEHVHHRCDLIADTGDGLTGDVLIQFAAFGEMRYQ